MRELGTASLSPRLHDCMPRPPKHTRLTPGCLVISGRALRRDNFLFGFLVGGCTMAVYNDYMRPSCSDTRTTTIPQTTTTLPEGTCVVSRRECWCVSVNGSKKHACELWAAACESEKE